MDIDIEELKKAPWNYRKDDAERALKLEENIRRNGLVVNIIVRECETGGGFEIINGNHRFDALKRLGAKKAHAFCCGKMTTRAAKRLAVETNEAYFESDIVRYAELVKDILEEFPVEEFLKTVPHTLEQLQNLGTLLDFDWENFSSSKSLDSSAEEKLEEGFCSMHLKVALSSKARVCELLQSLVKEGKVILKR